MRRLVLLLTAALGLFGCSGEGEDVPATVPSSGVVTGWNERVLAIAEAEDGFMTLKGVRAAAMLHVAMHDALTAVEPRFRPFAAEGHASGADPIAAANEAAYAVAVSQYPDQESLFEEERRRWGGEGSPDEEARSVGRRAASAVLSMRAGDGWNDEPAYQWHPMAPGVYAEFKEHSGTPEGFIFGAGWAAATPFMLESPSRFRSPPPPDVNSVEYAMAFNEVKEVGQQSSDVRTADQAHFAMWWKEFVEKSHNRLARELVAQRNVDLWDAARMFALLNMSVFDGYVASFDSKFHYNHWRPYTAIRWASHDGNPNTEEDAAWTNLHDHTYAFPSYPSAHGTVCAAAMTVLGSVLGDSVPFSMTIREAESAGPMSARIPMDPATRSFPSFMAAAEECSISRLYLGIHFRYDSEAGTILGQRVGEVAVREFLTPHAGEDARSPAAGDDVSR